MKKTTEEMYFDYCRVRNLSKELSELQTWGKEPMIEFAEQVLTNKNIDDFRDILLDIEETAIQHLRDNFCTEDEAISLTDNEIINKFTDEWSLACSVAKEIAMKILNL